MRALPALALGLLALAFLPTADAALLSTVGSEDPDMNQGLRILNARLTYMDANRNGRLDVTAPDETVYFAVEESPGVTYGDIRLTPFGSYRAGTAVGLTDLDVGRQVSPTNGWLGSAGTTWYADMDNSDRVSPGDVRLVGAQAGTKVQSGDAEVGTVLSRAQTDVSLNSRVGHVDADADGQYDPLEVVYFDLDGGTSGRAGKVSFGDLRLAPIAAPAPTQSTRTGTVTAGTDAAGGQSGGDGGADDGAEGMSGDGEGAEAGDGTAAATPRWRTLDWMLIGLGIVNLVGLVVVYRMFQTAQPRNPFK